MRTRAQVAVVTLVSFVLTAVVPLGAAAQADPKKEQAKQFFDAGKRFYEMQSWRAAIEQFKQAQALLPSPILDYNIGICYEKLGKPKAAVKYYKRYLAGLPQADNRGEVEGKIAALEAQIAAAPPPAPAPPAPAPGPTPPPAPPVAEEENVPPAPPPPPPGGYYEYGQRPSGPPPAPPPPPPQPRSVFTQWWFWTLIGVGTLVLIIALVVASNESDPYYTYSRHLLSSPPAAHGLKGRPLLWTPSPGGLQLRF